MDFPNSLKASSHSLLLCQHQGKGLAPGWLGRAAEDGMSLDWIACLQTNLLRRQTHLRLPFSQSGNLSLQETSQVSAQAEPAGLVSSPGRVCPLPSRNQPFIQQITPVLEWRGGTVESSAHRREAMRQEWEWKPDLPSPVLHAPCSPEASPSSLPAPLTHNPPPHLF